MTREGRAGLITGLFGTAAVLAFIVYAQSNGGHYVAPPAPPPTAMQACRSAMPTAPTNVVVSCAEAVERKEQARDLQRGIDGYNAAVERADRSRR
jgi:hypothetical protein